MKKSEADKINMSESWKICSSCKKPIEFNTAYWICSVSTCNQKRTGWVFCKVECWDAHVPKMSHRQCWAVECKSPRPGQSEPDTDTAADSTLDSTNQSPDQAATQPVTRAKSRTAPTTSGPKTIVRRRA